MNTLRILCASAALLFNSACVAVADAAAPNPILGSWGGACDAWGVPARCSSNWTRGLHENHLVQEYRIVREEDGAVIFAGRGVYRIDGSAVRGAWEGSNGAVHPIIGTFENDTLSVVWGTPETEIGRSEYSIVNNALIATDFVLTASGWREFMSIEYELDRN